MARIGPSVLVEAFARRRDVLDVDRRRRGSAWRRSSAAGSAPPRAIQARSACQSEVRRFGEHHVEIAPAVRRLAGTPNCDCASRRRDPRRVHDRAERAPAPGRARAIRPRRRRVRRAAAPARRSVRTPRSRQIADRRADVGAQAIEADVAARRRHAVPVEQALEPRRVAEQAAERLDAPVSEAGEQFELPLERLEHARRIELKRKSVDRLHARSRVIQRRCPDGPVEQADFRRRDRDRDAIAGSSAPLRRQAQRERRAAEPAPGEHVAAHRLDHLDRQRAAAGRDLDMLGPDAKLDLAFARRGREWIVRQRQSRSRRP